MRSKRNYSFINIIYIKNIIKFLKPVFLFSSILFSFFAFIITIYSACLYKNIPEINPKIFAFNLSSTFYDKDGKKITDRFKNENRELASFEDLPKDIINAVIATEDRTFWKHEGIDLFGIIRAAIANLIAGTVKEGGSTLTQQLAKNVLIDPSNRSSQSFIRKIKEALIALNIEEQMSKQEILVNYLNVINFGEHAYGIKAASKTYFNKLLNELTLEESALIVGIPQSPSDQNPIANLKKANNRKNTVLDRMYREGYITKSKLNEAKLKKIKLNLTQPTKKQEYGYFIDTAIDEVDNILKKRLLPSLYSGGYSIYTSLDRKCQEILESQFKNPDNFPLDVDGEKSQGAMVIYDQKTGDIKGIQGGREYETIFGLNRALAKDRQPGSTFKPIVSYGPAIELGLTANDEYIDGAININGYKPKNASLDYQSVVTVRTAIQNSINTVAVQVLNDIGPKSGYNFAKKLGIELSEQDSDHLSIALGGLTNGVSVVEMARAYGVFGNEGIREKPHTINKIINNKGKVVYEFKPEHEKVISSTVAWYITDLLQTVVNTGTGIQGKLSITMAGKTGTTELFNIENASKDLWFIGYTPNITGAVWIGFDKPNYRNALYEQYGGGYTARLWKKIMSEYLNNPEDNAFIKPEELDLIQIEFKKLNILGDPKTKKQNKEEKENKKEDLKNKNNINENNNTIKDNKTVDKNNTSENINNINNNVESNNK